MLDAPTKTRKMAKGGALRVAPGPRGHLLLGSLPDMQRSKDFLQFYCDAWRTYGDVVRIRVGPLVQHLITLPEHVKHILVTNKENYTKGLAIKKLRLSLGLGLFTSEGELWRRQRRLIQPPFTAKGVQPFSKVMTDTTERMLEKWQRNAERGQALDVNQEMMRLAMNIIGKAMLSIDVGDEATETAQAFTIVLEDIAHRASSILDVPMFIPTAANRRLAQATRTLDTFIYRIIGERRNRPDESQDLLTLLLNARDEEAGEGMDLKQLRDEVLTIFFAGHETTAQALTWSGYLLSQHPEAERKLHAELASVLGGRTPTIEDVSNLKYTTMVFQEAMRLYPPLWAFPRDAAADDEIGGYHIPKGSMMLLGTYLTHRHPAVWENPEVFDPERFSPERSEGRSNYAFYPFGAGPRMCIGNHFAMLEGQWVLATVAQHFRLKLAPGHSLEHSAVATLRPQHGMWMTLQRR